MERAFFFQIDLLHMCSDHGHIVVACDSSEASMISKLVMG